MDKFISIRHVDLQKIGNSFELSATISFSDNLNDDFKLWFRFANTLQEHVNVGGDAFLAMILPIALLGHYNIVVNSHVSEKLIQGSYHIMRLWERWFPTTQRIDIQATDIVEANRDTEETGMFFSGGIDSFYTLLKNRNKNQSDAITSLIFVQGFDISLKNKPLYDKVYQRIKTVANHFNMDLIEASTNIRMLSENLVRWGKHEHGAALAGTGLALSSRFKNIYIAASDTYAGCWASSWGSHPLMDPLWSTESLKFIHDGGEATRIQKVYQQIRKSNIAKKHLRVCFENPDNDYNCCKCDKCIRAMIDLRIAGVLKECDTFPDKLKLDQIHSLSHNGVNFAKLSRSLQELQQHDDEDQDLQFALERFLKNKDQNRLEALVRRFKNVSLFG